MDPTVSPCKDFYAYANGAFGKVPIPGEYAAYGVNQEIDERNFAILKEILENSARTGGPKGSVVQRVGDFYASGMNEAAIDREGLRPLTPWLSRIQAITNPKELLAIIAQLQAQGLNVGFHLEVEIDDKDTTTMIAGFSQGGLGLPERDYYFRKGKSRRTSARPTCRTSLACLNWPGTRPRRPRPLPIPSWPLKPSWQKPLVHSWNCVTPRRTTTNSIGPRCSSWPPASIGTAISPRLRFRGTKPRCWFASRSFSRPRPPARLRAAGGLAQLLRWHLVSENANYLSKPFVEEHFSFYGKKLSGATELRPRWKRVLAAEDAAIGEGMVLWCLVPLRIAGRSPSAAAPDRR